MLQVDAPKQKGFKLTDLYEVLGIAPSTYSLWEKRGVAPRRDVKGGRWDFVSEQELARWLAQRDADRKATGKPWLRTPVEPYSWLTEEEKATRRNPFAKAVDEAMAEPPQEPADIDAEAEALALIIHRKALASGQDLDEETLGKVVAAVVRRAKDLKPELRVVEGGKQ